MNAWTFCLLVMAELLGNEQASSFLDALEETNWNELVAQRAQQWVGA